MGCAVYTSKILAFLDKRDKFKVGKLKGAMTFPFVESRTVKKANIAVIFFFSINEKKINKTTGLTSSIFIRNNQ